MKILKGLQHYVLRYIDMLKRKNEFALKFSDHQYSKKLKCEVVTFSIRYKRCSMTFSLQALARRPDLIGRIAPLEAYLIGMLIARERCKLSSRFIRMPIEQLNVQSLSRDICEKLYVVSLYEDHLQEKLLTLKINGNIQKTIQVPLKDFEKINNFIEFVSPGHACFVGQAVGEQIIQKIKNNRIGVVGNVA